MQHCDEEKGMQYNAQGRKMTLANLELFHVHTDRIIRIEVQKVLTEFHANVLIWILLPEFLILIFVTHERENDFLTDGLGEITVFF